jgi:integrase
MKEHRRKHEFERAMLGIPLKDDDLVFSRLDGNPLLPDTISHVWGKIVKRVGLKHFRLHDARHTHASFMLKQNVHPKVVQERLGHATISTTLDLYSHVTPGLQEAAALKFDEILRPRNEPEREKQAIEND